MVGTHGNGTVASIPATPLVAAMRSARLLAAAVLGLASSALGITVLSRIGGYKGGWQQILIGLILVGLAAALAVAVFFGLKRPS